MLEEEWRVHWIFEEESRVQRVIERKGQSSSISIKIGCTRVAPLILVTFTLIVDAVRISDRIAVLVGTTSTSTTRDDHVAVAVREGARREQLRALSSRLAR